MDAAEELRILVARLNAGAYLPPLEKETSMARLVRLPKGREFHFTTGKGAQQSKYPWDEWLNGDLLLLEKDVTDGDGKVHKKDFDADVSAMPLKIKAAARKHYKVVQISRRDADNNPLHDSLIIRARDMTAEERTAEDQQRVKDKEVQKQRILASKAKKRAAMAAANGSMEEPEPATV